MKSLEKSINQSTEDLLLGIILDSKNTLYGKKWKFEQITTREKYQEIHPLTTYSHYEEYIQEIESKGTNNILSHSNFIFISFYFKKNISHSKIIFFNFR